jgi:hypothetical protein
MNHHADILLTKQDLARRWQVSLRTVQRWLRRAPIRTLVITRGSLRWRLEDVLALEKSWQAAGPGAGADVSSLVTPQPSRHVPSSARGPDHSARA